MEVKNNSKLEASVYFKLSVHKRLKKQNPIKIDSDKNLLLKSFENRRGNINISDSNK
tara:strand:- start:186 stop:356 length:171 start_codon:yes stop_codon:yes gene_type:complete